MRVAFVSPVFDLRPIAAAIVDRLPWVIPAWPGESLADSEALVCWQPPPGTYRAMPRLRLIHGIAAGVDSLLQDQDPGPATVCRVVDPAQATGMLEYVRWAVGYFHRDFDIARRQQALRRWHRPTGRPAARFHVGIMGLGRLGGAVARGIAAAGYATSGWSRGDKSIEGVRTFAGTDRFGAFLADLDVVVCTLPLTTQTRGILAAATFERLPPGAAIVNVGRGEHLLESDLLAALASGRLRGAVMDTFAVEPLPSDHPFWPHPAIVVTPHMATMPDPDLVARQIAANLACLRRGEPLANPVSPALGY